MSLRKARWRLVLGSGAEQALGSLADNQSCGQDVALEFLYCRAYGDEQNVRRPTGTLDASQLTVPEWINAIHELFPQRTIERLEKDALERYRLEEMVTNPDCLRRAEPSVTLLKAVMRTKHLMNQEVLAMARALVRRVIEDLMKTLAREVRQPFTGALDRRRRSPLRVARNFDAVSTLRQNLKHYDLRRQRIVVETPLFYSRVRRRADRFQLLILVDQSGSMIDNVIHSAITASVFHGIPALRTRLIAFDTSIVDLTEQCSDPVETLMKVQLGGGTDIQNALAYAGSLVENPRKTIIILVSDFGEGAPPEQLVSVTKGLVESGVTILGLAALDSRARPSYDRELGERLVAVGMHVAAMTPGELAAWVAEKVR